MNLFLLTPETVDSMSVDHLLYEHPIEQRVEFILPFRRLEKKYGISIDRSKPIAFV